MNNYFSSYSTWWVLISQLSLVRHLVSYPSSIQIINIKKIYSLNIVTDLSWVFFWVKCTLNLPIYSYFTLYIQHFINGHYSSHTFSVLTHNIIWPKKSLIGLIKIGCFDSRATFLRVRNFTCETILPLKSSYVGQNSLTSST